MTSGPRAIESEGFPFEVLSDVAEAESWRKEIHRPIHYIHKWWARRLGSVFRAIVIGALASSDSDVMRLLYEPTRFPDATVFDPFMGSGITIGESLKLGTRAIGRDINPVAYFLVRNALAKHDRRAIIDAFASLEREISPRLRHHYRSKLPDGRMGETLYYFWVKQIRCPSCDGRVDLFASRIFSQNAYPKRNPRAQATCPECGCVNEVRYDSTDARCEACHARFDPQIGPAKGQRARCPACRYEFLIAGTVRRTAAPPAHRLYAKLVLTPDGDKLYLPADEFDRAVFAEAEADLIARTNAFPIIQLEPGYNTNQALGYGYRFWHQFFNARQLLCLSILADGIRAIEQTPVRELMTCLFSGALEFNNMFASFKGEGTGAVRHMFSHHILKPERTPLEANLWGTPASSGSFSGLFVSRILRALDYSEAPTELRVRRRGGPAEKISSLSGAIGADQAADFRSFVLDVKRLYLSCGDSSRTDIDDCSIDAVITDPPFFDNVHYSQLADFFHVWQRHILGPEAARERPTTRSDAEVQDEDNLAFSRKLEGVFRECRRVLKTDGILVFTYHHSREEGWTAVLQALMQAEFCVTATHPVKAEMSVAQPKVLAKDPIDLDIVIACRKRGFVEAGLPILGDLWTAVESAASIQIERLTEHGRTLSRNDVRVIVMSQAIRRLSGFSEVGTALAHLSDREAASLVEALHGKAMQASLRPAAE